MNTPKVNTPKVNTPKVNTPKVNTPGLFKLQILILLLTITSTSALLAGNNTDSDAQSKAARSKIDNLTLVANGAWKAECGSCHLAFPPGLLPERSWKKMMGGLDKHFGENASVDEKIAREITQFLVANSADLSGNRRSTKILQSIPPDSTPLRITETNNFIRKHDEISASVFKRTKIGSAANCSACHKSAEQGDFSEHNVSIPR